jgi:LysR family transcriptional regulator, nitrogen assimilation regulatory protein
LARVDIRKLRYFVGIAEAGGFRRAAKNLHVAQPALSNQIRDLEAEFGKKLIERSRLGISLTAEGQRLLAESREIIERVDRLAESIEAPATSVQGTVKTGAPFSVAAFLFGPLASRLRQDHPDIHLKCANDTAHLMELLTSGDLDLAVISRIDPEDIGGPWHVRRLLREQTCLVGLPGTVISQAVDFNFVLDLPLVLSPAPHPRRLHMQRLAAARGRELNVAAEAGAIGAQASFVQQGLGYAVMPFSAATLIKSSSALQITPIDGLQSWRLLVRSVERQPSAAAVVVGDLIVALFKEGLFPSNDSTPSPLPIRKAS